MPDAPRGIYNTDVPACQANEVYHDLEAGSFDEIHKQRHRAEARWRSLALPVCLRRTLENQASGIGHELPSEVGCRRSSSAVWNARGEPA
jgi:hypothetical protein